MFVLSDLDSLRLCSLTHNIYEGVLERLIIECCNLHGSVSPSLVAAPWSRLIMLLIILTSVFFSLIIRYCK